MSDLFCPNCGYEIQPLEEIKTAREEEPEADYQVICEKCWGADSTSIHECLSSECECDGPH